MPIKEGSPEARQYRFFSQNPGFVALQPTLKLPENQRVFQATSYCVSGSKPGVSTTAHYRVEIPHGIRRSTFENRQAIVLAGSEQDIWRLVANKPSFKVPQLGIDNSATWEVDWKTFVWFNPGLFYSLNPEQAIPYLNQLQRGQIPLIDVSTFGGGRGATLSRIMADNTRHMRRLNLAPEVGKPIKETDLRDIADKYDPYTEYGKRYQGMLLNLINLPPADMLAMAVLTPSQRAEAVAIVKQEDMDTFNKERDKFIKEGVKEGLREIGVKRRNRDQIAAMVEALQGLGIENRNPTTDNDMEQLINLLGGGNDFAWTVRERLLSALNLPSSGIATLAFEEPPHRLAILLQPDTLSKDALNRARQDRIRLLTTGEKPAFDLWSNADELRLA